MPDFTRATSLRHKASNWLLFTLLSAAISACGGGSGAGSTPAPPVPPTPSVTPPVATITAVEQNELTTPVKFSASVSNPSGLALQYAWNFGDGQTSTSEQPQHQYTTTGNYAVSLAVTSSAGTSTSIFPIQLGYFSGLAGLDCTGAKNAQGWCKQSYLPTSENLLSIKMTSKTVAWALGQNNTILRSIDGGNSWFTKRIAGTAVLTALTATDANTAWVVGNGGFEAHTKDGGLTWSSGRMPANTRDLSAIAATGDASTVWATGDYGVIFQSTDGGATWNNQSLTGDNVHMCKLWSVSAVDKNTAWAVGPACIARTSDGGQHWVRGEGFNLNSVSATDANTAWIAAPFGISKTIDGGKTWTVQLSSTLSGTGVGPQFASIAAVDANTVVAVDYSGFIVKTGDGGASWKSQSPPESIAGNHNPNFKAISAFDASNAIAVGMNGAVYASNDGLNWKSKNKGTYADMSGRIDSIAVFDADHAVVSIGGYGLAYYTANGGLNWLRQDSPQSLDCAHSMVKLNATTALGLGCGGPLLKSIDQGKTWQKSYSAPGLLRALSVVGEKILWVAGESGTITHSNDGGASWAAVSSALPNVTFRNIFALDENTAWAVGDYGTLVRTTDAGKTWKTQSSGSIQDGYSSIIAIDANNVWATHSSQSVIASTDGGATWSKLETGVTDRMLAVATLDGKVLWAAGTHGAIVRSEDGGKTWTPQASGTTNNLLAIRLIDNNTAWVTGDNSTIIKTTTGGK